MTDLPQAAIDAATQALRNEGVAGQLEALAAITVEAAAPHLAEHVAQKIIAHMNAYGPNPDKVKLLKRADLAARMRRIHFDTAARIAASAFMTDDDIKRAAGEALADLLKLTEGDPHA